MEIEVIVFRRPNMFKVNDNLFNMVGYIDLEGIFTNENYKPLSKTIELYYPERFLNILEERTLIRRLESFGFEKVKITTHSEHICTTVPNDCLRVVQDELIEESSQFRLSNDWVGLPDDSGLNVIFGGGE